MEASVTIPLELLDSDGAPKQLEDDPNNGVGDFVETDESKVRSDLIINSLLY